MTRGNLITYQHRPVTKQWLKDTVRHLQARSGQPMSADSTLDRLRPDVLKANITELCGDRYRIDEHGKIWDLPIGGKSDWAKPKVVTIITGNNEDHEMSDTHTYTVDGDDIDADTDTNILRGTPGSTGTYTVESDEEKAAEKNAAAMVALVAAKEKKAAQAEAAAARAAAKEAKLAEATEVASAKAATKAAKAEAEAKAAEKAAAKVAEKAAAAEAKTAEKVAAAEAKAAEKAAAAEAKAAEKAAAAEAKAAEKAEAKAAEKAAAAAAKAAAKATKAAAKPARAKGNGASTRTKHEIGFAPDARVRLLAPTCPFRPGSNRAQRWARLRDGMTISEAKAANMPAHRIGTLVEWGFIAVE